MPIPHFIHKSLAVDQFYMVLKFAEYLQYFSD